ncbi:MAG: ABC transporter substrate-binding protein [Terriglobales bacterium]|jgi:glutamine transport system substrate-binding protein
MTKRILRVGIDKAQPVPMQLGNPETGDFRGYEVDLLNEVGRRAGFGLSFRRAPWNVIIHELVCGEIDMVCSAATITSEREREVDFCSPYLDVKLAVVKRSGIGADTSISGLRLGVRCGTTAEAYVRQYATVEPVRLSESNDELYTLLAAGEVDAVVDDSPIAEWFARSIRGLQFAGVLPGTESAYAIIVGKGNHELLAKINTALEEITNDGTRHTLLLKWFDDGSTEVNG